MVKELIAETEWFIVNAKKHATKHLATIDFLLKNIDQHDYNELWMAPEMFPLVVKHFSKQMSDNEYWQFIGKNYVMYNPWVHCLSDSAYKLFKSRRVNRHYLMSKREQAYFNRLPDILTIYRGMSVAEYEDGLFRYSWTLSKKVATFFAGKYHSGKDCVVVSMQVKKSNVIAYFGSRNEKEVIYFPTPKDITNAEQVSWHYADEE